METTHIHKNKKYTFSNENLQVGDKVFPISNGVSDDKTKTFKHRSFDFRDFMCGFPDEPHILKDLKHSDYKPYETRTDQGYGPVGNYLKIIKEEKIEK